MKKLLALAMAALLALAAAGRYVGGPAKVAVLASGFFGTISGSSVANTVSTGTFTIPLMKSVGYRGAFAGAVEAASSTGGQIMPPVMGSGAFIMAELIGYNVYRNGVEVNAAPVADAAFTDAEGKEGDSYFVTAVYAEGESRHSNEVMAATSGIDGIAAGGITVKGEAGRIVVGGADGREVAVYGVDGIVFFHGVAKGDVTVDVVPGLYIVVADSVTAKVRVP